MPSLPSSEPEHVKEKARRELLDLLEGVSRRDSHGAACYDKILTILL